jgi:hypothetical protein
VHFSPQIWFIRYGGRDLVRHVVPIGTSSTFMNHAFSKIGVPPVTIPWDNKSSFDMSPALLSRQVHEFVLAMYEVDLAYFRGEPRLMNLSVPPVPDNAALTAVGQSW